jgi:hypothetical protein
MTNRTCGDCQLCCRVLPTKEIGKPANTRCTNQCRGGCAIYSHRPMSCQLWSCRWLMGDDVGGRPDRTHLVVDMVPDYITLRPHDGSAETHLAVVQVWLDPAFRHAHRDPAFRRWLDAEKQIAMVRYSPTEGFVLAPPSRSADGRWHEETSAIGGAEHTLDDVARVVGPITVEIEL